MYPMSLLCRHQFPPPVITGIGCQIWRASHSPEKCTMRMLVQGEGEGRIYVRVHTNLKGAGPDITTTTTKAHVLIC